MTFSLSLVLSQHGSSLWSSKSVRSREERKHWRGLGSTIRFSSASDWTMLSAWAPLNKVARHNQTWARYHQIDIVDGCWERNGDERRYREEKEVWENKEGEGRNEGEKLKASICISQSWSEICLECGWSRSKLIKTITSNLPALWCGDVEKEKAKWGWRRRKRNRRVWDRRSEGTRVHLPCLWQEREANEKQQPKQQMGQVRHMSKMVPWKGCWYCKGNMGGMGWTRRCSPWLVLRMRWTPRSIYCSCCCPPTSRHGCSSPLRLSLPLLLLLHHFL